MACGEWLTGELEIACYAVYRQSFAVPYFEATAAELVSEGARSTVHPQPIVVPTGPGGVSGPLVRVDAGGRYGVALKGAIALVDLPYGRWSSMLASSEAHTSELQSLMRTSYAVL